ncbi:MAG: tetratricopeptide repeat protein, partial [Proteobacteria bacterium]|nr:tetratricopeptide repeat protein [Pseudomonadota bacterium]
VEEADPVAQETDEPVEEEVELNTAADEVEEPEFEVVSEVDDIEELEDAQADEVEEPLETDDLAEQAISEAIDELMDKIEPELSADVELGTSLEKVADDTVEEREDEYVDLSAELGMGEVDATIAPPPTSTRANETFDEFRTGLEDQLRREDTETHYNLGIAYMEMELYKEASKEFKVALKDPSLELDCYSRLGMSAMAESNADEAITYFKKALKVEEGWSEDERKGCMYELALAYEAAQNRAEAAALFTEIHEIDSGYREVAVKVAEYGIVKPRSIPMDDSLIEVELL